MHAYTGIVIVTHLRGGCWNLVRELTFSEACVLASLVSGLVPSSIRAAMEAFRPTTYIGNKTIIRSFLISV